MESTLLLWHHGSFWMCGSHTSSEKEKDIGILTCTMYRAMNASCAGRCVCRHVGGVDVVVNDEDDARANARGRQQSDFVHGVINFG